MRDHPPLDAEAKAIPNPLAILGFAGLYAAVAGPALIWFEPVRTSLAASVLLGVVLVFLSAIDLAAYRLPDALTLPLIGVGLCLCWWLRWDDVTLRALAAAVGYGALFFMAAGYRLARGWDGLGLGDAKLFAAAGSWTGLEGLPGVLLIASVSALAAAGLAVLGGRAITATTRMPFGPFLAIGFWLVWLYGPVTFGL